MNHDSNTCSLSGTTSINSAFIHHDLMHDPQVEPLALIAQAEETKIWEVAGAKGISFLYAQLPAT
jgi:hypothetical protein